MYNLLMLLGSSHELVPQFPGGSDSVMQATSVSKTSKAASLSSSPILSNISRRSYQSLSMSSNHFLHSSASSKRKRRSHQSLSMSSNHIPCQAPPNSCDNLLSFQSRSMYLNNPTRYVPSNDSEISDSFEQVLPFISVKSKPPKIETLYNFLNFQSFDGSFLPSSKFYSWFDKKDFKDFEVIGVKHEKILCLALAIEYLEIIMFETFKDECEMCYEKAKKALKKEVGDDEQKIIEILKNVKEWVKNWADE
ncbi:31520_t:CDS:1 [Racocetra persica]|uniref:31520_t:CDS:1 n=1 Tax=Racocetra persica TaxID=160502 RepID=A0ACA9RS74_9GLOM|nr:31520_t:CDS:1 [Racocetra persica]